MRASFVTELFKLRKRPANWVLAAVALVLSLIFGYLIPYVGYRTGGGPAVAGGLSPAQVLAETLPASFITNMISGFPLFVGAIAVILGALSSGSEYGWGTLKTALIQRPSRLEVFGGKLGALLVATALMTFALFGVAAAASALIAAIQSAPMHWPSAVVLTEGVAGGWLILSMWALLGMLLGFAFRSAALAVGLGLVWTLVIENLIRSVAPLLDALDKLQQALPGVNAGSLAAAVGATVSGGAATPGVVAAVGGAQAAAVLVAFALAFSVTAGGLLRRRDVT